MKTTLQLLQAGYCTQQEWIALRGGRRKTIRFPATVGLIRHAEKGIILFDTGYSLRNYTAIHGLALTLFSKLLPVYVAENETVISQLKALGIAPEDVKYILVSHFHADHCGGLRDFPEAVFITLAESYEFTKQLSPFQAATKGAIKSLIPDDFEKRTLFLSRSGAGFNNTLLPPFPEAHDLWGDGSMILVPLEGHFRGQFGLWLDCGSFMVADACWLKKSFEENILPHPLAFLLMDDVPAFRQNLQRLHEFHKMNPGVTIIPSHEAAYYNTPMP